MADLIRFDPATRAFYDPQVHALDRIPSGAIPISRKRHAALLTQMAAGSVLDLDRDGRPVARKRATLGEHEQASQAIRAEARRRILAIASLTDQANDNAAIAQAAYQFAAGGVALIDAQPAIDRRRRIDAVRATSNAAQAAIATASLASLAGFDAARDVAWPD